MNAPAGRLVSLDALRGLTIAAMILVNNPGSWSAIYAPLQHAPWHGWTPTDLIFPFFLFMVGVSTAFSARTRLAEALRRAALLFGLGLLMAAYPSFQLGSLRIPGVLQRIALCYLAVWLLRRRLGVRGQAGAAAALLAGYWALLTLVPVPGGGPPNLEPGQNLAAWLDRALLDGHLWRQTRSWDPEGPLSTLPAVATTILGSLAGELLRGPLSPPRKAQRLAAGGALLAALGLAWGELLPINKNLWTSSYAVFTGGLAALALASAYHVADVRGARAWTRPFVVYGTNAIAVFVASGLLAKTLARVSWAGAPLQEQLHRTLFASWLPAKDASLGYALANVAGWYLVLLYMDRRGWHLKV